MPEQGVELFVISKGRPGNVAPLQQLLALPPAWVVPPGEADAYRAAGAAMVFPAAGGLAAQRNTALERAFAHDHWCCQVDDDLVWTKLIPVLGDAIAIPFTEAVGRMVATLMETPYMVAGVPPTDNAFFAGRGATATNLFLPAKLTVTRPSTPRYDPDLKLKEDYDFTCQHLDRYGGALRCNRILTRFRKGGDGGANGYRTPALENEACRRLLARWPQYLQRHPRRAGELLLKAPRAGQRTLLT